MKEDDWIMGAAAAQDAYQPAPGDPYYSVRDPSEIAAMRVRRPYQGVQPRESAIPGIASAVAEGLAEDVMTPGRLMQPNPYPPGSEEADWYNDQRMQGGDKWARGMALNTMGTGAVVGAPVKAGETILGAGAVRPKTLFDYTRLNEVPNVSQFDLPRYEPPRGVSARVQDLIKNDDVAEKMLKMMQRGREIGGDTFYGTEPLRDAFMQELGRGKGQEQFKRYMDFASGASPRSKVPENARNASYYYVLDAQGKPMPAIGDANPAPYGHLAQRLHQQNANTIVEGGWDLFRNPKPPSFSENLQGNLRPVTVDAHAFKAPAMLSEDPRFLLGSFKPAKDAPTINPSKMFASGKLSMEDALKQPTYWAARPNDNEYLAMENYYKRLSREAGFPEPGVAQAAGWSGGGEMTGLGSPAGDPFIRAVENRANITAEKRGISPAEALSQMMRGKAPFLGLGGAAVMGGLAAPDQYQAD
jgi:hypothetical protein